MDLYDVTFIGAGPTGLFGCFYAGFRDMKTKIIDSLPEPGGQVTALYPEKIIYDAPGFPQIEGKALVKGLVEQGFSFEPTVCLGENAQSLERQADGSWRIGTHVAEHFSKTVIVTAGVGAFAPNRLKAPGVAEFEGRGIYYFVKEKAIFQGKRLLIVGGGDSAVDWALNMRDTAQRITLIHRRDQFRAHEGSVAELKAAQDIDLRLFYELKEVRGNAHVTGATIFNNKTKEQTDLDVDVVLLNLGYKADLGPITSWGFEMDEKRGIKVNERMETNLPGVYAAGDVATPAGVDRLPLIVIGYAQVTVAVNCANKYIHPEARVFPGHSSEKM
ncbi:MAG: NAD(P)/FAD-dependent oxidoreductase [Chloroflexi bacterium]|nr:NAD(P)/FAD-dependent oxidoreductase [Chloroflexota bacterium]